MKAAAASARGRGPSRASGGDVLGGPSSSRQLGLSRQRHMLPSSSVQSWKPVTSTRGRRALGGAASSVRARPETDAVAALAVAAIAAGRRRRCTPRIGRDRPDCPPKDAAGHERSGFLAMYISIPMPRIIPKAPRRMGPTAPPCSKPPSKGGGGDDILLVNSVECASYRRVVLCRHQRIPPRLVERVLEHITTLVRSPEPSVSFTLTG